MSAYVTVDDLENAFSAEEILALTDRDGDGSADPGVADAAIAAACSEMDGYFDGGGYAVPLATVPPVVKRIALNIARYYLYTDAAPDIVTKNYKAARKWLRSVSADEVRLGTAASGETPAADGNEARITSAGNVFARDPDCEPEQSACSW